MFLVVPDIGYNCTTPILISTNILEHVNNTRSDRLGHCPSPWPSVFKCMSAQVEDFDVSVKTSKAYTVPSGSGLFISGIVHAPVFCGKMTMTANAPDSPLVGSVVLTPDVLSIAPGTSRISLEVKNHGNQAVKTPAKTILCNLQQCYVVSPDELGDVDSAVPLIDQFDWGICQFASQGCRLMWPRSHW